MGYYPSEKKKMGEEKLIINSEKVRFIDILSLLLLRRPLASYHFVDAGDGNSGELGSAPGEWFVALTEIIQKALAAAYYPAKYLGIVVEFFLNFVALNGGLIGIVWNIFRCKLVIPLNREAPNFRSMIAMIDGRTELKPMKPTTAGVNDDLESGGCAADSPLIIRHQCLDGEHLLAGEQYSLSEVTVMAAKIAYENAAYIENVVNNVWKFNFVGFYSCWNKFVGSETTQAFVMTERAKDASLILVAFRGTEPFNMQDWSTDVNLSWLGMGPMGHVHVGFLKALGLQEVDGKDATRAFPRQLPTNAGHDKPVAYYKLRDVVRDAARRHPNARVVVTGHSLGGALAAAFPSLLAFHGEADLLARLSAVHTYGSPRVGDATFSSFLATAPGISSNTLSSLRVVYRYDIVPRVPFDAPPVADYRHGGRCVYYDGWYAGKELAAGEDAPNKNYFDPRYLMSMYGNAWGDLIKAIFLGWKEGKDFREGIVSIVYRAAGVLFPGLASHSPRDYVNAIRLGRVAPKEA
uniref:Fungal lipase-type domain-containing protein n=1 Tax=Leersia perrieri TaxID=77586 RepID=A0A0D9WCY9_9ORYZ